MIEKWTMVGIESALAGATIGIVGLEETVMDVLVRVELSNGITHRAVLRPTEKSTTIPESFSMDKDDDQPFRVLGYLTAPWRYSLLLVAAWLLSLTPMARKRGILFCAVALAAGCLCGYSIGKLPIVEKISTPRLITDTEAKRIVQGLMLNTYRAFIMDKDEEVYDVLDRSVEKAFLSEVYLQSKEALGSGATKGTMSIVDRLDVTSIESMKLLKDDAVAMIARWDVYGSVRHGDHIHYRCNTYKAELVIVPTADYWKIITLQLLDEDRVI